mgnify:CR=1 FL=1
MSNEPNYELFKLIVNYEHFAISLTLIIKLIVLLVQEGSRQIRDGGWAFFDVVLHRHSYIHVCVCLCVLSCVLVSLVVSCEPNC